MLEGLPPNNAAYMLRLITEEEPARQIADAIVEMFDPTETAASAFELEPNMRDWNPSVGPWVVEAYFADEPKAPPLPPPDEPHVSAFGASDQTCLEWSNACQICVRKAVGDEAQCSTPGFACVPEKTICRRR